MENGIRVLSSPGIQRALDFGKGASGMALKLFTEKKLTDFLPENTLDNRIAFIRPGAGGAITET